jgi:SagB-type dehydrogenase family enzyme
MGLPVQSLPCLSHRWRIRLIERKRHASCACDRRISQKGMTMFDTETDAVDNRRRTAIVGALAAVGGLTLLPASAVPAAGTSLAAPERTGRMPLEQALARRRSVRHYRDQPLALAAVSQLLWAAQGTTGSGGRRTAPSAGALYPLELHLVAERVEGLAAGVHRYLPATHALERSVAEAAASTLQRAAMGQPAVGAAAAVVAITAVEARAAGKYGARAGRYVAFEAGAAAQGLALQAVSLGLGTVVIGGFDEAAVVRALRLPQGERPVVLMPVGVPG